MKYLHWSITGDGALNEQSGRIHANTQITSVKMDKPTVKRLMPLSGGFLRMLLAIAPNVVKFQYVYNQENKTVGGIQKVATKRGKFKDYMNEIQNSIELGFPSFAMHETSKGSFAVPHHVYNGKVYTTDEKIVDISDDDIDAEKSQLLYFKEGASIYGLMGPQEPAGPRGFKGDPGSPEPTGSTRPAGKAGVKGDKGDAGAQGAKGPAGEKGDQGISGPVGDKGDEGDAGPKGEKGVIGPPGNTGPPGAKGPDGPAGEIGHVDPAGMKGPKGPTGEKGDVGPSGGPKGDKGDTGPRGLKGEKGLARLKGSKGNPGAAGAKGAGGQRGATGGIGPLGPRGADGPAGAEGPHGTDGLTGPRGRTDTTGATGVPEPAGGRGQTGSQGATGGVGPLGPRGADGAAGPAGEPGEKGEKGEKGQQGDTADVVGLLDRFLPFPLALHYALKQCYIRHYISANLDSIVSASSKQVQKLNNMNAYKPTKWNFEAYFNHLSHKLGHYAKHGYRAGYYLDIQNSAYTSPYDFVESNVNAVYIVYNYPFLYTAGKKEINYLFSSGKGDNVRGIYFLDDKKTMRIYGYMDITHFPNSYYNPCLPDRWNVLCIVYDTKHPESSAVLLNNGKLLNFTCPTAKVSAS